jgi:cytoskeletal protein RodZ
LQQLTAMAILLRPDFGEWLRQAREERQLTLDTLTQQTRIPRRHLEALEHGRLGLLPEFYQRAEVRTFARAVGVDEHLALAQLRSATTPVEPDIAPPRRQASRAIATRFATLGLAVLALAAGLIGLEIAERRATIDDGAPRRAIASAPAPSPPVKQIANPAVPASTIQPSVPNPATASAGITELVITTQPSGARVTVNGIGWGMSPIAIRHLPPGTKRVRVSKDGYGAVERVLALDEGLRRAVDIRLASAQ